MSKMSKLIALVILSCFGISYGAEYDIKTITTIMDAYEEQLDSIKLKYSYETFVIDKKGNREFVKGTFAQKKSEGYVLLDEISQKGKTWGNDKEPEGIIRSYNGKVTRYLEHEKNDHGYHMAALYENHNPDLYKTKGNPYYRILGNNYKHKFTDLLNDPNGMATIQGEEVINGLKAIKINLKAAEGLLDYYLWLLPEKNYLPIKLKLYHKNYKEGKQRIWEMHWSEFKEFTGGVWYPMDIKMYHRHLEEPITIKIEKMDISPLTKEDFEFKFPDFTHVTDHVAGISYVTTEPIASTDFGDVSAPGKRKKSCISNSEKERVLDRYIEDTNTNNTSDNKQQVTEAKEELQRVSKTDISRNKKERNTLKLILPVVGLIGLVCIIIIFAAKRGKR
jgi:hypothetical protein